MKEGECGPNESTLKVLEINRERVRVKEGLPGDWIVSSIKRTEEKGLSRYCLIADVENIPKEEGLGSVNDFLKARRFVGNIFRHHQEYRSTVLPIYNKMK